MRKILITGINGFAGSHLRDDLSKDKDNLIVGTDLHHQIPESSQLKLYSVNLINTIDVKNLLSEIKPDWVFHLAALTSPAKSFTDPYATIGNNIQAEINLLEGLKEIKSQARILIIGSGDEYGMVKKEESPIRENQDLRPTSPYAVSKIAQDYLALQYALSYQLDIVRVRPFNHIGPRQSPNFVVSSFARQIAEIEKELTEPVIKTGNLSAIRDFTYVGDMVKAYSLALAKGKKAEVYNIGSGKGYSMKEVLTLLLSLSAKKIRIHLDQVLLRPQDNPELICDPTKFFNLTGWQAKVSLEEALKKTLDYWRKETLKTI